MKLKCVSFTSFLVNVNLYEYRRLSLFEYIFVNIILNEKLKDRTIKDCLNDLDFNDDLLYLFKNIYYEFVDNEIVKEVSKEFKDILVKDIEINEMFNEALINNYLPVFKEKVTKEFIYNPILDKLVVNNEMYDSSNVYVVSSYDTLEGVNELVSRFKKELFAIEGVSLVTSFSADPYYFEVDLKEVEGKYSYKNEHLLKNLDDNYLSYQSDTLLKGEMLTNNLRIDYGFGMKDLKDNCKYLFISDKSKEFLNEGNIIYVDYDLGNDFIDLGKKESYHLGYYFINDTKFTSYYVSKANKISEFKLYLVKNKEKFKCDINDIIEHI